MNNPVKPADIDLYIARHTSAEPEWLHALYRDTYLNRLYPRMCAGHVQGRILKMLTAMIAPHRVLELGTFSGYSALCLAEGLPDSPDAKVHTIEIDDEAEDFIRRWLASAPCGDRVELHIGDALEIVPRISAQIAPDGWDMVYIDANKRHYIDYLEMLLPLMASGGYILADNTLWSGKVTDPDALAHDAQGRALDEFNNFVANHPRLETVILPLRDGLTILRLLPARQSISRF